MNKKNLVNTVVGVVTLTFTLGALVFGYLWQHTPSEKYSPVVEAVQDKTVMIAVPTIEERMFITFTETGMEMHTATVPVTMLGAGVLVSPNGLILTCAHVVEDKPRSPIITTLSDGTTVATKVIYSDKERDLALVKIEPYEVGHGKHRYTVNYHPAFLTKLPLRLGQEVIAVGNPEGQNFSTSHGIISHLNRDIEDKFFYTELDAPINPGNSGGPVFNLQGELIGIAARKWQGSDGLGLAIAPETIKEFLALFKGV